MRRSWILSAPIAFCLAVCLAFGGVAFAASLFVTAKKLTVHQDAATISASTCTVTASEDTYVDQDSSGNPKPADTSFGTQPTLIVRSRSTRDARTLVKFSFASCANFSNALVTSADLRLFLETSPGNGRQYGAHRVTGTWNESTTWNTPAPGFNAGATASVAPQPSGTTLIWGVGSDVQAFVNGTANNGWLIKDTVEGAGGQGFQGTFSSKDQSVNPKPTLVITYYP